MKKKEFCVIIISHGRPDVPTEKVLRQSGYTGDIYIVVDDEDKTLNEYKNRFGDKVHVFHKEEWFDVGDNWKEPRTVGVFARNECKKVACNAGVKYYLELDDDLMGLQYRYESEGHLKGAKVKDLDKVIERICDYFDEAPINGMGFGNAADYIGGLASFSKMSRKYYNSFFLRTSDDIMWLGRHSDDSITQVLQQKNGKVWYKFLPIQANYDVWLPKNKSKKGGGSISTYNELGAYLLRYYLIMFHPDCTKISLSNGNIDNSICERNAYPCVISERYKK